MPNYTRAKTFFVKLTNWEFWPFSLLYFPVFFYYGWLSLKARSFFFFTAANPKIEFGGMMGEKKSDIFSTIPSKYLPKTFLVETGDIVVAKQCAARIGYPLIAKPDIGERGIWVKKIENDEELTNYTRNCPVSFLLQELIDYPIEIGVFFVKFPGKKGMITSIVQKEFLEVTGDGKHTMLQLLKGNTRALLTADLQSEFLERHGKQILGDKEKVLIEPIGNHCRGTKFLNLENEIDQELINAVDRLASEIPEFYFGRFDLRCKSFNDLRKLENFKILELNGAGAEPGHIYHPGFSLLKAYKVILWHLRVLADISIQNHKRGIAYWDFKRGYKKWRSHKMYNRLLTSS